MTDQRIYYAQRGHNKKKPPILKQAHNSLKKGITCIMIIQCNNEIFCMVLFDLTLGVDRDRNFTRMIHVHVSVKARTIIDTWIGQQNIFLKIRLHKKKYKIKTGKVISYFENVRILVFVWQQSCTMMSIHFGVNLRLNIRHVRAQISPPKKYIFFVIKVL
jgi:hypothetical protein